MIDRLLYAHGSLFGRDGYGFFGGSLNSDSAMRREVEVLINKLGYDERMLRGSPALFWLNLPESRKILGEVSRRDAHGKTTLFYKLIIPSPDWIADPSTNPLDLLDAFADEKSWKPDTNGKLPELNIPPPRKKPGPVGASWNSFQLPPELIRGVEPTILKQWFDGLSDGDRKQATFAVPETRGTALNSSQGACHFSAALTRKPDPSTSKGNFVRLLVVGLVSVSTGLFIGYQFAPKAPGDIKDTPTIILPVEQKDTVVITSKQEEEFVKLTDAIQRFAGELQAMDATEVLSQNNQINLLEKEFGFLEGYLSGARNEDLAFRERYNHLSFALDQLREIVAYRRNLNAHAASLLKHIQEADELLSSMTRTRLIRNRTEEPSLNEKLQIADNLIEQLRQSVKHAEERPSPISPNQ